MGQYFLCVLLFRILLPVLISTCVIFRPSGLSAIYLLILFYLPFVPVPKDTTMTGHTGIFLKILIALSVLTTLSQFSFQMVLLAIPDFLQVNNSMEKIFRHAGFVKLNHISPVAATIWLSPEILMFAISIAFFITLRKLSAPLPSVESNAEIEGGEGEGDFSKPRTKQEYFSYLVAIGRYCVLIALCLAAVSRPSILGGLYFFIFLTSATWWASYRQLRKGFGIMMCCLLPVVFVHLSAFYFYQFQWSQDHLDRDSPYARYFGLIPLVKVPTTTNSTAIDPRNLIYSDTEEWASYVSPFMLYLLYYILVLESKELLKPESQKKQGPFSRLEGSFSGHLRRQMSQRLSRQLMRSAANKKRWQTATRKVRISIENRKQSQPVEPAETTPLIRGVNQSKRGSGKRTIFQDSTGSVTVTGDNAEDIPLDVLEDEEYNPSLFENIVFAMESILQLIVRSSYIGTNIIMMAWSITYLSWITFVLLIWANLIWLIPNQRKSMLRSSPFLVIYAWFLLISAYIYSMDLKEYELPTSINGFDLEEVGFVKIKILPCLPLFVKCLFTVMFWVTLRQFMQERMEEKQSSALADMVAPLHVTVGTAAVVNKEVEKKGSRIMERIGQYIKQFLTKFWIWVVAITLFAVAITGQRMTGFRIIYMALFLLFILSFQFSFQVWRRLMFSFWLIVIIYSMVILVLIYTYQFHNFPIYWTKYLRIPEEQQLDIGLEQFKTKQLFVRLVTPTFFVIITVIQLHYFHDDFMILSDPKTTSIVKDDELKEDLDQSSMQGGAYIDRSDKEDKSSSIQFDLYELGNMSTIQFQQLARTWLQKLHRLKNLGFLFLELHMIKIVLLFAMLICINDMCALYFIIVLLISLALTFGRPVQVFAIYVSSLLVSMMLLARMIYQIQYITPGNWNVTCEVTKNPSKNESEKNNAPWLGFVKTEEVDRSLPSLVKWNIIYILILTLWAIVLVRQQNYRISRGRPTTRAFFMFPNITRADADKTLTTCCKYLANYGYYKFGVEISFIMTVALIGIRMDMYSVIYAIWLCVLFPMKRSILAKVWVFYLIFIAIMLPVQYFMAVGLPPSLCIEFPWDGQNDILRRLQDWAFLLDNYRPLPVEKLICDFLLLMAVSRQWVVFRIEKRYSGSNYAGGSNKSIIHHAEETNFQNPVPDYITYVRSYLDIIKRGILQSFLWITLAIVFLAGTNRINIFSLGYLLGAFIFLWHGSDFYLRPIPKILRQWQWLLGYNIFVIFLKTSFQILGCIFIHEIPRNCCWLVQLLGIGCVRKFGSDDLKDDPDDPQYCQVQKEFIGIAWDGMCFALLILQRRIFNSYDFFHIVNESKATTILASRGAELIEEMRLKTMKEQEEMERKVLEKIKMKMDRIKANQQKIQGDRVKATHAVDSVLKGRPKYRVRAPTTNKQAIRSGDYYMFDELEDEEIDLLPEEQAVEEEEKEKGGKPDVGEIEEHEPRSVRIKELPDLEEDPQPGTSKDEDISDLTESKDSLGKKILHGILFLWAFIESAMISLTNFLNRHSRDYRYVLRVLAKEKRILKEKTNYNVGLRLGPGQVWQPAGSYHSLLRQSMKSSLSPSVLQRDRDHEYTEEMSSYDQPTIFRLLLAIWYIVMSRSELLCYFVIFLNQIKNATFLSLPLPLMVFFWGSVTIPRPTKTFWVTIIAYTEVIVLLKCMFQFDIMPGNTVRSSTEFQWSIHESNPFFPPKMIGLQRQDNYAMWDLLLLLVVFFHRVLLKSMGIWSSSGPVTAALLSDGDYRLENGQLVHLDTSSATHDGTESSNKSKVSSTSKKSSLRKRSMASKKSESEDEDILTITTRKNTPLNNFAVAFQKALSKYAESFKIFIQQLMDPTSRVAADVYSLMFLCDFINFFVLLFGYSSFGSQQDGGVASYFQDDRVPPLFLFMLILQFMLIVIDRGIYLRKNILGKIIFQFTQIILLHIWLFILFPVITGGQCNTVLPPQIYYMMKCFYLLLSAFQIRCGYPTRILGNFLCKGYGYVNMFLFKGFMLVPFLFELRTCMDWMWTETSMTVFDWIKMEDIFAHIFLLKCSRHAEDEFPQPRGEKKKPVAKYLMGSIILALIIGIIWFPLVFFSLGNAVGEPNIPYDVTLEIRIGPYEPIYRMSAQSNSIFAFTEPELDEMRLVYNAYKVSETFLYNYEAADVAAVKLSTDSANIWSISPPDRKRMVDEINSTKPLTVRLEYKVSHKTSKPEDSGVIPDNVEIIIPPSTIKKPSTVREELLKMLEGETVNPVIFQYILPKFLKVTNRGTAEPISELMLEKPDERARLYRNITINLLRPDGSLEQEWWKVHEECNDFNFEYFLSTLPYEDCKNSLILYTFNDKIFPPTLNFLTGGGIIGLYTTLVLLASRILRGFFADGCSKIMFEDMPNVDRVLQLCLDIYLVREACEFALEEDLFAKLVFLFRSPETLIKWTRPKEELIDDDDPEGEGQ